MGTRLATTAAGLATALAFLLTPTASAATEFGDTCLANETVPNVNFFELSAPGNPLPTAAPSSGVLTQFKVNVIPTPGSIGAALSIVRLDTAAKSALVVSRTDVTVTGGTNSFPARIPVQAGDRLALAPNGEGETLICEGVEAIQVGAFPGIVSAGLSTPYAEGGAPFRVPLSAVIEPDADGDGYGDETQDLCPQSAAIQTACPLVKIDSLVITGRGSATVYVITDRAAPVKVSGTVALGKGSKAKLSAKKKTVSPGKIAKFKLKFPAKLKQRLGELGPGEKLTLKLSASATNVAGQAFTDKLKAKLKG